MDNNVEMIRKLADLLALDEMKSFNVGELAKRFASAEEQHRYDQVIRNVGGVIEKKAQHNPNEMISPRDMFGLYNRFASLDPNTKFREVFADLLPATEQILKANPAEKIRHDYSGPDRDLQTAKTAAFEVEETEAALEHPVEALIPAVDKFNPDLAKNSVLHNPKLVEAGRKLVATQLETIGCGNVRAELKYGVKSCLLYLASFPTPKGRVFVNVPIAVKEGDLEIPSLFADLSGKKVYAFNRDGIEQLLNDVDAIREEMQANAADSKRHNMTSAHRDLNAGTNIEVDEVEGYVAEVAPPSLSKLNPELADVEAVLTNAVLRKQSKFSGKTIDAGRDLVRSELTNCGHKNADIRFAGDNSQGMNFDATLQTGKGKLEITVPVGVVEGTVVFPSVFAADDGEVHELSAQEIEAVTNKEEAVEPIRYSAALIGMDYNSLRKIIHKATFDRKYNVAKEALALVHDKFGADAYNSAISDFESWLEQSAQDFSSRCGSCKFYRPSNSRYATSSTDYCNLLHTKCGNIVKKAGICSRAHIEWDRLHDDSYKGTIITNNIKLT
jgi:hypothetical protein